MSAVNRRNYSSSGSDDDSGGGGDGVLFMLWQEAGVAATSIAVAAAAAIARLILSRVLLPAAAIYGAGCCEHTAQGQCRPSSVSVKVSVGYSCRIILPSCAPSSRALSHRALPFSLVASPISSPFVHFYFSLLTRTFCYTPSLTFN